MKYFLKIFFFGFILFVSQTVHTFHQEEYFLRGNTYAKNNEWEKAVAEYEHISHKSGIVLHNIAVCLYALGQFDRAHLCWYAALRITDRSHYKQIAACLYEKFQDTSHISFFKWLSAGFSLFFLQVLMVLFWYLGMICMFFCKKYRNLYRLFFSILILLTVGCLYSKIDDQYPYALVQEENQTLFSGPSYHYNGHGSVKKGSFVRIVERYNDWCFIKSNTASGWISASKIECR